MMKIEIGSYEAKTKLPELLRGVQAGNQYTITLRGEAIADLVPSEASERTNVRVAVEQMQYFMATHPPLRNIDVKALIEEGRD